VRNHVQLALLYKNKELFAQRLSYIQGIVYLAIEICFHYV
jgi:hypothetical protein